MSHVKVLVNAQVDQDNERVNHLPVVYTHGVPHVVLPSASLLVQRAVQKLFQTIGLPNDSEVISVEGGQVVETCNGPDGDVHVNVELMVVSSRKFIAYRQSTVSSALLYIIRPMLVGEHVQTSVHADDAYHFDVAEFVKLKQRFNLEFNLKVKHVEL